MGKAGYDPQTQWEEYSEHCQGSADPNDCSTFNRVAEALSSTDGNSPLERINRFFDDPKKGVDSVLEEGSGRFGAFINSIQGSLSDAYNSWGYDGWKPEDNNALLANADRVTHEFLAEAAGQRVTPETMEKIEQLKELGHDFSSVSQHYIDRIEADPGNYGLRVENDPSIQEAADELGNLGEVYTTMNI